MIENFLRSLFSASPSRDDRTGPALALAALLVRLARADSDYGPTEQGRIDALLARKFGLGTAEAWELRAKGEAAEAGAADTVRFTRALKDAIPHEERGDIIEVLWDLALINGSRDTGEDALIRLIASLLGISDRDSALARQRVIATRD